MALLQSGSLFANRFEIDRAAGAGGMGTVYRAVDRYSGEPVALKLLLHRDLKPAKVTIKRETKKPFRDGAKCWRITDFGAE